MFLPVEVCVNGTERAMKRSLAVAICLLGLSSLSACNDSGTWVDAAGQQCKNGKFPGDPADIKMVGQAWCATRQKNFTGDSQCKGDDFQVKCN
jgi:hypothetical protein